MKSPKLLKDLLHRIIKIDTKINYTITYQKIEIEHYKIEFNNWFSGDYKFECYFYPDGKDFNINAVLLKESQKHNFWDYPFELYDYDTKQEMFNDVYKAIEKILKYKSKIIVKKGILFYSMRCMIFMRNKWHHFYKMGIFKFGGFKLPKIKGRIKEYYSNPMKMKLHTTKAKAVNETK